MPTIDELLVMVDELLEGTEDSVAGLVSLREYYEGRGITNLEVKNIGKYDELFDPKGAVELSNVLERYVGVYAFFCRFMSISRFANLFRNINPNLDDQFDEVYDNAFWRLHRLPTVVRRHMLDLGKEIALPRLPERFNADNFREFIAYLRGINGFIDAYTDPQSEARAELIQTLHNARFDLPGLLSYFKRARRTLVWVREGLEQLRARKEERMLALAMAGHRRLGGNSLLRGLSDDVLRTVWEMENRNYEYGRWFGDMY